MMTRGTRSPYSIGEIDFYCGIPMTSCPYEKDDEPFKYAEWQMGWRDAFVEYVSWEDRENSEGDDDDEEDIPF